MEKGTFFYYWNSVKNGAKTREIDFSLTQEYILDLLERQQYRCALTGIPIGFAAGIKGRFEGQTTASLDRIDSDLSYKVGNVQWVHRDINRMKSFFVQDHFIELCRKVVAHHEPKTDFVPGLLSCF